MGDFGGFDMEAGAAGAAATAIVVTSLADSLEEIAVEEGGAFGATEYVAPTTPQKFRSSLSFFLTTF